MRTSALDQDLFAAAVGSMPADELSAVRHDAASRFASLGFPTARNENWKYTNLSGAAAISNAWLREHAGVPFSSASITRPGQAESTLLRQIDANWIVIRNGSVDMNSLERTRKNYGAVINFSHLSDRTGECDIDVDDPMSAFNAALLLDGLHISVSPDSDSLTPLGILQIDDPSQQASQVRIVLEIGRSSSLRIVECALSANHGAQFTNAVIQASIASNACLSHVRLQLRGDEHVGVSRITATLDRDARFHHDAFDFGGSLTRNDVVAIIAGTNAQVRLHGLYLASGNQHIDNHTRVEHRVGPAVSDEEYRGVLSGRSRAVFNGQAVVFKGADGTDANQSNHNLLLSSQAEIDTKPELEIYADDVKCSHGATVGQLDEASLFYLRSRGLDQGEAKRLLTQAFASEFLSELSVEVCREYLTSTLDERLADLVSDRHL